MFKCVNCGYEGHIFSAEVDGFSHGSYTYRAKCPKCESTMVNVLPGIKESELRIATKLDTLAI